VVIVLEEMQSRGRAVPQVRRLRSRAHLALTVAIFSLLRLAHALQPNEREKLDRLSQELDELEQTHKQVAERLDNLAEELDQTREHVVETSVLTTRSVETMLGDLRATKWKLSTRAAALEHRVAAQELESKRSAAQVRACLMLLVLPVKDKFQAASDRA